ncbi:MAG: endonuclease/exonuclease/phosphatase family protein [Halanaerobiales bacterium]
MKLKGLSLLIIILVLAGSMVILNLNSRSVYISENMSFIPEDSGGDTGFMTYNIQRGLDLEGKSNLSDIAELINDNGFGIVGLNEVDRHTFRSGFRDQIGILAEKTGMNYIYAPNVNMLPGSYGNALLTRYSVLSAENYTLPVLGDSEPRGLLAAEVLLPDGEICNILVTHLSLNRSERKLQLELIEEYVEQLDGPYFLLGDFNGEKGFSANFRPLIEDVETFPADKPAGQIDYIISDFEIDLQKKGTFSVPFSDHLPLYVRFNL